jgi:hypothetical protein
MGVDYDSDDSWTTEGWKEYKSQKIVPERKKKKIIIETKKDSSKKQQEKKTKKESMLQKLIKICELLNKLKQ